MAHPKFCTAGSTAALKYAASKLWADGWEYDASAKILLLPVPSFDDYGRIVGGGRLEDCLCDDTIVFGGNLHHKALEGHKCIDLLQDSQYLAENAAITAHCALRYAMEHASTTLSDCSVLVVGWGRIGKCLTELLKRLGANVTVYARKEADRAMALALGFDVLADINAGDLKIYNIVYNTVPQMLLPEGLLSADQIKIDLASFPGIGGKDVIWARGLPNKDAPKTSGQLIARTVERLGKEFLP